MWGGRRYLKASADRALALGINCIVSTNPAQHSSMTSTSLE
jgi:hypothetical protein